jgi:putative phosphoesterase
MKTMIISDIHGYSKNLKKVLEVFYKEGCKKLIILGDLLTPGHDYEEVKKILNDFKFSLLCMQGNNDRYLYNELDFNVIEGYLNIKLDDNNVYITHGDRYNKNNIILKENDILISGHTHRSNMYKENNRYFINPGSISLPRDNTDGSYIIYEDNKFYLYDIDSNFLDYLIIDNEK